MHDEMYYDAIVSYCIFWNTAKYKQKDGNRQSQTYMQKHIAVKCTRQIADIIDDSGGVIILMPIRVESYRK